MPTYDYKCTNCGFTLVIRHPMNETEEFPCHHCSYEDNFILLKKMPSIGLGVHFKGSGFYETDYKGK